MNNGTPAFIAECGHEIPALPAGHCGGTGYGTQDINGAPFRRCYQCCADVERQAMIDTGVATLYLDTERRCITDWACKLSFFVVDWRQSKRGGGFGSQRTDAWFTGPDGKRWHAVNSGNHSQIARCKRVKECS